MGFNESVQLGMQHKKLCQNNFDSGISVVEGGWRSLGFIVLLYSLITYKSCVCLPCPAHCIRHCSQFET